MQVSVHILTWNDLRYLPDFFRSLEAQTYKDITIRVLDNGSTDGTLEYIQRHHPHFLVARNVRNLGFAAGHNQLVRFALERWQDANLHEKSILFLNADMILHERLLEELLAVMMANEKIGAVQPKVLRAFADVASDDGLLQNVQSDILDSTGLALHATWRLGERGAGEIDKGQYDTLLDVVGVTGASALWRASTLKEMTLDEGPFDADFFTYREDHDLAVRARRAGWWARYVPLARAYRYRGAYGVQLRGWRERLRTHREQRPLSLALNARNQLLFLLKNLTFFDTVRYGFSIVCSEGVRLLYGVLFEAETRRALLAAPKLVPRMLKKRRRGFLLAKEPSSVIRAYVGA